MTKWNQQTVYSQLRSLERQEVKPSKRRNSSVSRALRLEASLSQSQPQPTMENHLRLMAATLDLAASHNFTVDEYKTILHDAAMDLRSLFNS